MVAGVTELAQVRARDHVARPHRRRMRSFRVLQHAMLVAVVIAADFPLAWILVTALKPDREIASYPPTLLPSTVTLDNFVNLFRISPFASYLANSVIVSAGATTLTVVLGTLAAYTFARFHYRFLHGIGELSLFAYMVPPILVLVPIAQVITSLHLANNLGALIVLYTATLLPFALWVLRSYFLGYTLDLEQAAMVDGCTRFGAFRRVVVPQAMPGLISTAVFTFNAAWSEYLFASTLMSTPTTLTLSPGLALLLNQTGVYSWGVLMAASVIVVLPVIFLFIVAQRQLVSGLGAGAVKG